MPELKKYSLAELKRMPKQDVIKLDMRQMPLPEKVLNFFHNRYKRLLKRKVKHPNIVKDSEQDIINYSYSGSTSNLYVFSLANILLSDYAISGKKGKAIFDLYSELGMKRRDIFSFNYHLTMSNKALLQCQIINLCFPENRAFFNLLHDFKINTLGELLNLDISSSEVEKYRGYGPIGAQKILNHILNMGFEIDSYPFLKSAYWEIVENTIQEKKYACIKEGAQYKEYGIIKPYVVIFSHCKNDVISPFEGTYKQCVAWVEKNTRTRKQ